MNGKNILFALILITIGIIFTACADKDKLQNNVSYIRIANNNDLLESYYTDKTEFERAKELKDKIEKLEGIDDVSVYITGRTALIGLVIDNDFKDKAAIIKDETSRLTKKMDREIENTAITSNPEIKKMIDNMEIK